jgi:hypothetical protein
MKRRGHSAPAPGLFDLPLAEPASPAARPVAEAAAPQPQATTAAEPPSGAPARPLPLFPEPAAEPARPLELVPDPPPGGPPLPRRAASRPAATIAARLLAGAADLLVHAALGALLLVGTRLMGLRGQPADGPPLLLFLLVFSFFYTVVPLAFWGQTLGMAWRGLEARAAGDQPLTLGQTARRWLGGLLSLALAGLPVLWALSGRSLSDRLSGSWTWRRR